MSERDDEQFQDEYDPSADVTEIEGADEGWKDTPLVDHAGGYEQDDVTVVLPEEEDDSAGVGQAVPAEDLDATEPAFDVDVTEDMGAFAGEQLLSVAGVEDLDATEDMFVVLPDGEEDGVPLVETHEVDDGGVEFGVDDATELYNPDEEETEIGFDEVDESGVPSNLDDLSTDLDDELFSEDGDVGFEEEGDVLEGMADGEFGADEELAASSGGRKGLLLAVAAVLVVGGVAGFFVLREFDSTEAVAAGTTTVVPTPALTDPVVTDPVVVQPLDPVDSVQVDTVPGTTAHGASQEDLIAASQTAFREKFLVALELGFGGSVSHE